MARLSFVPSRDYILNYWVSRVPLHGLRMWLYRALGTRIGAGSTILMSTELNHASELTIGAHTVINQHCYLDGRGGLSIGDNVNISSHVILVAGSHDVQDGAHFSGSARAIAIESYAWLGTRCTVLAGVRVGHGAVVAAGAVVTRSVEPYTIVAGVPARPIGTRTHDLTYTLDYDLSWR